MILYVTSIGLGLSCLTLSHNYQSDHIFLVCLVENLREQLVSHYFWKVQNPPSVTEPNGPMQLKKSLIGKFAVVKDLRRSCVINVEPFRNHLQFI